MENRALGKGLSALIPDTFDSKRADSITQIRTDAIKFNSFQPRKNYDDEKLAELVASIKEKGVLQPLLVREKDGGYEVIAGERRLRAALALGIEEVPVLVRKVSDQEALVLALVENIQREELNAIEEANAFKQLIEDFGYSQEDVAKSVGKDRSTISNLLRLLKLSPEIQKGIIDEELTEGHARALLGLDDEKEQKQLYAHIVKKGLSVRETEQAVKLLLEGEGKRGKAKNQTKDFNLIALEEGLQQVLGTKVRILAKKNKGKIIIEYYSYQDLERIINIFKK